MAREIILVNGIPGSGKSTLAARLARGLGAPLLSKDRVKEALADSVGHPIVERGLGAAAMEAVWHMAAWAPDQAVIDSWWFRPRDLHHARKGVITARAAATIEIWCDVPVAVAQRRYRNRSRHAVHRDSREMAAEWSAWAADAAPLALGPVIRIDTRRPVNVAELVNQVAHELRRHCRQ